MPIRYADGVNSLPYPEDEFDEAGKTTTAGLHRQRPSQWRTVLPFLIVLIIVPLLAWGAATAFTSHRSTSAQNQPEQTVVHTVEVDPTGAPIESQGQTQDADANATPTQQATQEASPTPTAEAIAHDATIQVLNGTGRTGLAGSVVETLQEKDYTALTAANADGWLTEVTTIYYRQGMDATAEDLAKILGIDMRQENSDAVGDADVVIVLKGDFQE